MTRDSSRIVPKDKRVFSREEVVAATRCRRLIGESDGSLGSCACHVDFCEFEEDEIKKLRMHPEVEAQKIRNLNILHDSGESGPLGVS